MRTTHAVFGALLLLLAVAASAATERHVHQTLNLDANGRLSINTHNGSITINTWSQPKVDVEARVEPGEFNDQQDVDNVDVRISGSGRTVSVETNYDRVGWHHMSWPFGDGTNRSLPPVHYTISVPATATVDIEDHNAIVRIAGLQGDLRINGHNGRIDVTGHSGAADITAHNGDVRLEFARFARPAAIETHNGAIDVRMPADARFDVDARGHHLGVDSDFPITAREVGRDSYVGNVNGGGTKLRIETHNGSVRLRRS